MARHQDAGRDLVELHRLDPCSLVFASLNHTILDRVVNLVVGDDGRCHANRGEGATPDGGALHPNLEIFQLGEVGG